MEDSPFADPDLICDVHQLVLDYLLYSTVKLLLELGNSYATEFDNVRDVAQIDVQGASIHGESGDPAESSIQDYQDYQDALVLETVRSIQATNSFLQLYKLHRSPVATRKLAHMPTMESEDSRPHHYLSQLVHFTALFTSNRSTGRGVYETSSIDNMRRQNSSKRESWLRSHRRINETETEIINQYKLVEGAGFSSSSASSGLENNGHRYEGLASLLDITHLLVALVAWFASRGSAVTTTPGPASDSGSMSGEGTDIGSMDVEKHDSRASSPLWQSTPQLLHLLGEMMLQSVLEQYLDHNGRGALPLVQAFAWGPSSRAELEVCLEWDARSTGDDDSISATGQTRTGPSPQELFPDYTETKDIFYTPTSAEHAESISWPEIRWGYMQKLQPRLPPAHLGRAGAEQPGSESPQTPELKQRVQAAILARLRVLRDEYPRARFEKRVLSLLDSILHAHTPPVLTQLERPDRIVVGGRVLRAEEEQRLRFIASSFC